MLDGINKNMTKEKCIDFLQSDVLLASVTSAALTAAIFFAFNVALNDMLLYFALPYIIHRGMSHAIRTVALDSKNTSINKPRVEFFLRALDPTWGFFANVLNPCMFNVLRTSTFIQSIWPDVGASVISRVLSRGIFHIAMTRSLDVVLSQFSEDYCLDTESRTSMRAIMYFDVMSSAIIYGVLQGLLPRHEMFVAAFASRFILNVVRTSNNSQILLVDCLFRGVAGGITFITSLYLRDLIMNSLKASCPSFFAEFSVLSLIIGDYIYSIFRTTTDQLFTSIIFQPSIAFGDIRIIHTKYMELVSEFQIACPIKDPGFHNPDQRNTNAKAS